MEGLSLRPSDAQAGGFLDDADVRLQELRFVMWDYGGKAPMSVALKVVMIDQSDDRAHEQYYSAGDPTKFAPSPDGKALTSLTGSATGLNASTNALAFLTSLVNAGFPEDRISNDVSVFDGTVAHVNQVAQPKRTGLKDQKEGKTYLLATYIARLPWEEGAAPTKPAKGAPTATAKQTAAAPRPVAVPAATPTPATPAAPMDLTAKAREAVTKILIEKGGVLEKGKLPTFCFQSFNGDPDRNAIVQLVHSEAFLAAGKADGAFAYDGTLVSLA
jgi:hypothetical protein